MLDHASRWRPRLGADRGRDGLKMPTPVNSDFRATTQGQGPDSAGARRRQLGVGKRGRSIARPDRFTGSISRNAASPPRSLARSAFSPARSGGDRSPSLPRGGGSAHSLCSGPAAGPTVVGRRLPPPHGLPCRRCGLFPTGGLDLRPQRSGTTPPCSRKGQFSQHPQLRRISPGRGSKTNNQNNRYHANSAGLCPDNRHQHHGLHVPLRSSPAKPPADIPSRFYDRCAPVALEPSL